MNILFTPPSDQKVLDGTKTMTARFWKQKPPSISEIITASTGRKLETRFAKLKIIGGFIWYPGKDTTEDIIARAGYSLNEIGEREGFDNWKEFVEAYVSLNQHLDPDDSERTHYFLEFQLLKNLRTNAQLEMF